ncbi:MAG: hypothetical protein HRU29_13295 [Rhizobiales bacterium]|nr:hypothetical protein [Hyphomicrobiales bacterium]NRB15368.1 hypothetical protein [Hyphomicrobiales bacterium]
MTGEQDITQGTSWQQVTGATGAIILQNQSHSNALQYYIGTVSPGAQTGINLAALSEHTPNIRASEALYARSLKADVRLAWSE